MLKLELTHIGDHLILLDLEKYLKELYHNGLKIKILHLHSNLFMYSTDFSPIDHFSLQEILINKLYSHRTYPLIMLSWEI